MSTLRDHLQAIRDEHGLLTPELVVDAARSADHPLHSRFTWDDTEAAEKWRVHEAGQLLRVTFRPDPEKATDLRAFVAIKGEDSPRSDYVPVEEVATDDFASELLLRQMKRDWQTFKRRYDHMAEFVGFVREQTRGAAS